MEYIYTKSCKHHMSCSGNVWPGMLWHVCGNQAFRPGQMSHTSDKEDKNLLPETEL